MSRKNVVSLFLFVILAVLISAFAHIVINDDSPQKTAQHLGNLISQRNDVIRSVSDSLSKEILLLKPSANLFESRVSVLIPKLDENVNVAIYDNNELRFWSGHQYFPNFNSFNQLQDGVFNDPISQNIYLIGDTAFDSYRIIVFELIYERHLIENQLITNGFSPLYKQFASNYSAEINTSEGEGVYDTQSKLVFRIAKTDRSKTNLSDKTTLALLFFLLIALSLLYFFGARFLSGFRKWQKSLIFLAFVLVLPILVTSSGIFDTLFGSKNYYSNFIFQNLAIPSLLVFAHGFLSFSIFISTNQASVAKPRKRWSTILTILFLTIIPFVQFTAVNETFQAFGASFTLSKILSVNTLDILFIVSVAFFSCANILLLLFWGNKLDFSFLSKRYSLFFILGIILIFSLISLIFNFSFALLVFVITTLIFLFVTAGLSEYTKHSWFLNVVGLIIIFSMQLTYAAYQSTIKTSLQNQQLSAQQLSIENDPLFEYLWRQTSLALNNDKQISDILLNSKQNDSIGEDDLSTYIKNQVLPDYFKKYDIEITTCYSDSYLLMGNQSQKIHCNTYFQELLKSGGTATESDGLFLMKNNLQGIYYLAKVPYLAISEGDSIFTNLYFEFFLKFIPEGLGFPELLIDEQNGFTNDFALYSIATYIDNELVYKTGTYLYPTKYNTFNPGASATFNAGKYRHVVHSPNGNKQIVVSQPGLSNAEVIAPFSIFLILMAIPLFIVLIHHSGHRQLLQEVKTFRFRLQALIVSSLLGSLIIIGLATIYYLANVYKEKNEDFLFERTQSILIELEHKLKDEDINKPELKDYLHQLLLKFSLVFFSDINLYNIDGKLIATSRYNVFDEHLLSEQMNPVAFNKLVSDEVLYFIQTERIGSVAYLSSYVPFRNNMGEVMAYINLPYFARETKMRTEVTSLIITYLSLFLLLASVAVFFVLILSRRLLKPLQLIQDKMKSLRIGKANEKIIWNSKDELGQLVEEYNNLIDELAVSAERLAQSERESAWREMARQVAHEIKNPLTPMRLSVQYLLRAWNDNDDNIDSKIKSISQTLINQIDTLSSIASAFSDFARMPSNMSDEVDITALINDLVVLFESNSSIQFAVNAPTERLLVKADKSALNRIFTNLIKNSIQAIGERTGGKIEIDLTSKENHVVIVLSDNGKGMLPEESEHVFSPYFTTKTSGMGIGLAMTKNLITGAGGEIWFETAAGVGTKFYIQLPLHTA